MEPTRAEALERSMESVAAAFICVHEQNQAPSVEEGVLAGAVSRLSASIHKPCVQAQTVRQQDDASGTVRADQHVTSAQPACPQSATRNKVRAAHEAQDAPASDAEAGAHDMLQSPSTQDVFAVEALRGLRSGVSGQKRKIVDPAPEDGPASKFMKRNVCGPESLKTFEILARGMHVANKPQMQKTARAGQKRWKEQVEKMRAAANKSKPSKDLSEQMAECKRRKLKSQKEALLLFLHSLKRDGLITAGPFCNALDTDKGFVGWTSFSVCKQSAADFYTRVESLFGEGKPQPNTVNSIFRRAGLLPKRAGDWTNAYAGKIPFVFVAGPGTAD